MGESRSSAAAHHDARGGCSSLAPGRQPERRQASGARRRQEAAPATRPLKLQGTHEPSEQEEAAAAPSDAPTTRQRKRRPHSNPMRCALAFLLRNALSSGRSSASPAGSATAAAAADHDKRSERGRKADASSKSADRGRAEETNESTIALNAERDVEGAARECERMRAGRSKQEQDTDGSEKRAKIQSSSTHLGSREQEAARRAHAASTTGPEFGRQQNYEQRDPTIGAHSIIIQVSRRRSLVLLLCEPARLDGERCALT